MFEAPCYYLWVFILPQAISDSRQDIRDQCATLGTAEHWTPLDLTDDKPQLAGLLLYTHVVIVSLLQGVFQALLVLISGYGDFLYISGSTCIQEVNHGKILKEAKVQTFYGFS